MAVEMDYYEGNGEAGLDLEIKEPRQFRGASPNPLIDDLRAQNLPRGVLIPLKTTQEVRQDHTIVQAYITRAPTKSANDVITQVFISMLTIHCMLTNP